jgi:hypothetical protein
MTDIRVHTDSSYDFQMYAGFDTSSNRIVLAYRGSSNIKNWIQNLKIDLAPFPDCKCKVHLGFMEIQNKVKNWVSDNVNQLISKHGNVEITVTGHSIGGAIATLSALELAKKGLKVGKVYTFG